MVQVATTYLQRVLSRLRSGSAAALLIVLALGVGEPLLCILHCTIWMPLAAAHAGHADHALHHQHAAMTGTIQDEARAAPGSLALREQSASVMRVTALQTADTVVECHWDVAPDAPPHMPSAQPFHEFALPPLIVLNMAVQVVVFSISAWLAPLLPRPAPLLRPPIV